MLKVHSAVSDTLLRHVMFSMLYICTKEHNDISRDVLNQDHHALHALHEQKHAQCHILFNPITQNE